MAWTEEARRKSAEVRRQKAMAKKALEYRKLNLAREARMRRGTSGKFEATFKKGSMTILPGGSVIERSGATRQTQMQAATETYNKLLKAPVAKKKTSPTYLEGYRERANAAPRSAKGTFVAAEARGNLVNSLLGGGYTKTEKQLAKKRTAGLARLSQVATLQTLTKSGTVRVATKQLADAVYRTPLEKLRVTKHKAKIK